TAQQDRRIGLAVCTTTPKGRARLGYCTRSLHSLFASGHHTATGSMLRFRTPSSEPLGDPRSAERWIATLPANDPVVAQRSITTEVLKIAARTARRTPSVLEAVFVADNHANGLARNLTTQ